MAALFGGGGSTTPKPTRSVVMPDINSPAISAADEEARRRAAARSGRDSTILSRGTGGSEAYKNTVLGQS